VLVVEPRRVACRALAARVADLEGTPLGDGVGYRVKDDRRANDDTRIVFATPGLVLRAWSEIARFDVLVIDELHERSLDVDLLLALALERFTGRLIVMSATLDGDRVAAHLGAHHLRGEGRAYPLMIRHLGPEPLLPDPRNLETRVTKALDSCRDAPGDVLVFLPGKAEITECARALRGRRDLEIVELHGGLALADQARAFAASSLRKVILATNVAETSLTIPGVGVVIDAGLVRQTRYHQGRGFLTLVPIAEDSAAQRAGRAGRTGPGVVVRLWSQAARLAGTTLPEIHRESLVPMVLGAAACGASLARLPLLDRPKDHALASATEELVALGALDAKGDITERGRELFGLPLDPTLGRLLVEARTAGGLDDAIDLVAVLTTDRPLFFAGERPSIADDLRAGECDVTACIRALRSGEPELHRLNRITLELARAASKRLRRAYGRPERPDLAAPIDRERLIRAAIAADARCVYIARDRGRVTAWSNGGTEIELGRESAVADAKAVEAILVFASRALGLGQGDTTVLITCATPVPLKLLARLGLGRDRLSEIALEGGKMVARIERVYARRILETREETPEGEVAREAMAKLLLRGSLFRAAMKTTRERLAATALWSGLVTGDVESPEYLASAPALVPSIEDWVSARIASLGVEGGDDLAMLSPKDFELADIPDYVRTYLDKEYPRTVDLGDASYEAEYAMGQRQVTLKMVRGSRREPPPPGYLPRFTGLRVIVDTGHAVRVVRERG
ncbi:MAG: helicase-related protein, partial [Polyangiaceae bacterium]